MLLCSNRLKVGVVLAFVTIACLTLWHFRIDPTEGIWSGLPLNIGPRPKVTLRQGTFYGVEAKESTPISTEEFRGIPYGQPTGGKARFKPSIPVSASTEEFEAALYGARCPAGPGDDYFNEDCLNVNVYRPTVRNIEAKLPVVVYIHGGGFVSGYGKKRDMNRFIRWSAEPIIGVSFNYRTGAFGFLPTKLAAEEGLLNVGLKDQVLALEWVKQNIHAFGGDPDNVTLMGNSAGAHSIGHHLFKLGEDPPLFHKVIIESGASTARACYHYDHPLHKQQFQDFIQYLGLGETAEKDIISKLRTKSGSEIKAASDAIFDKYDPSVRWPFQPVIDGEGGIVPIAPIESWKSGKWHHVPTLTGFNTNEGSMFVPKSLSTSAGFTSFFNALLPSLSSSDLTAVNQLYPDPSKIPNSKYKETRSGVGSQFRRVEQAYAQWAYIAPTRMTANFTASASSPPPVYLYHFAANASVILGAGHGLHSGFVTYNDTIRQTSETVDEIAGSMHAYWASFVATGDPNQVRGRFDGRPRWPIYGTGEGRSQSLVMFGEGNDEVAGGSQKGVPLQVKKDDWPLKESEFWWARTKLFES